MSDDLIIGLDPSNITAGVDRAEADLKRLRTAVDAVGNIKTPRLKGFREAVVGPIEDATRAVEASVGSLSSATRAMVDSQRSTLEAHARSMTALVDVAFNNLISSGSRGNSLVLSGHKEFNAQQRALFDSHLADVRSSYAQRAALDAAEATRATAAAASLTKAHAALSATLGKSTEQYRLEQGRGAELLNSTGGSALVAQVRQMTDLLVASEAAQGKIQEVSRKLSKLDITIPHGNMQALSHAIVIQQGMEASDAARQMAAAKRLAETFKAVEEAEAKALANATAARDKAQRVADAAKAWANWQVRLEEETRKGVAAQERASAASARALPTSLSSAAAYRSASVGAPLQVTGSLYREQEAADAARQAKHAANIAESYKAVEEAEAKALANATAARDKAQRVADAAKAWANWQVRLEEETRKGVAAQERASAASARARPLSQYYSTPDAAALSAMRDMYVAQGATVGTPRAFAGSTATTTWARQREDKQRIYEGMLNDGAAFTAKDLASMRAYGVALTASHRDVIKSMGETANHARDLHSAYRGLASGFGALWLTYGAVVPILAGAALSNAVVSAVKSGAAVAESLAAIKNMAGASETTVAMLNKSLLDTARSGSPTGIVEMADAYKSLAMAGVDAKDAVVALRDIENLAIAGGTSLKVAADTVTTVAVAFGVNANAYSRVSDVIFTASAVSKASVDTMSQAFRQASVVNTLYGVSLEDVGVGLALLHNAGVTGSAAGTALANMYSDLTGRTEKARKALDSVNLKFTDGTGKIKDLVGIARTLMPVLDGMNPEAARKFMQAFTDVRGLKELVQVLQASREEVKLLGVEAEQVNTTVLENLSRVIADSAGSASIAAAAQMLTPLNQMKMAANSLEGALVGAFQAAQPEIISASRALREMVGGEDFQNLARNVVGGALDIAEAAAKLSPAIVLVSQALVGVGTALTATWVFGAFSKGLTSLSGSMALVGADAIAATAAIRSVGVAAGATALGTEALTVGLAGATRAVSMLGRVVGALVPWLGVAAGVFALYEMARTRSAEDPSKGRAAENHKEFMERLKEEEHRLNLATEALQKNMGLKELENATLLGQTRSELQTKQAILAANQAYIDPYDPKKRSAYGTALPDDLQYRRQVVRDTEAEVKMLGEKISAMESVAVAAKKAADAQKENAERNRKTLGTPGGSDWNLPSAAAGTSAPASLLDDLTRQSDRKIKLIDETLRQGQRLLKTRNDANLLTDVEYFAQSYKLEEDSQQQKLDELERFSKEYTSRYLAEKSALKGKNADTHSKTLEAREAEAQSKIAEKEAETVQASTARTQDMVARLAKQYGAAGDSARKYWETEAKALEVADAKNEAAARSATVNESVFSSDKRMQASLAASTEATATYSEKLGELRRNLAEATDLRERYLKVSQEGFERANASGNSKALANYAAEAQALNQAVDLARSTLDSATETAARDAVTRGAQAAKAVAIAQMQELSSGIASALESALFDGGNTGAKALRKLMEKELLRKPFLAEVQVLLTPLLQALGLGSASSSTVGAATTSGGLSGVLSAGKGIYDAISGGFTKLGASVTSEFSAFAVSSAGQSMGLSTAVEAMGPAIEGGLAPTMNVMTESAASMATAAGSFAAGASGVMAGVTLGSTIAGDKVVFGMDGTTTSAIGSAIGLALGGPVGAVIGGTIGGVVNAAFGMGPKETTAEGLKGTLNASAGATVQNYTSWHQDGGWFRDDKDGTNYAPVTSALQKYLDYSVVSLTSTTKAYAKSLALGAEAVSSYSQAIDVDLRGLDGAAQKAAIDKALVDFGDGLAQTLLGSFRSAAVAGTPSGSLAWADLLSGRPGTTTTSVWEPGQFVKDGETASVALKRLATSLTTVNSAFDALGQTALATSLVGADNASKLMDVFAAKFAPDSTDASAGMTSFSQLSASYYDAFYSDVEKRQQQIKAINAATAGSGLDAATASRESYRRLVEAQNVTTDSGRQMYAALLGASSAFAELTQSATEMSDAVKAASAQFSTLQDYQFVRDMAGTAVGRDVGRQMGIPGFAGGGDHLGGARIVGEHGPELELTGASRIFTADQTRRIFAGGSDTSSVVERLDTIRDELARIGAVLVSMAASTRAEGRAIAGHVAKAADVLQEILDTGVGVKNTIRGDKLTVQVAV